jgi:hypothetical protein
MSELNPKDSDAVLGGQNPPPINGAILGGLAGAKQRLESESIAGKIKALQDAMHYGTEGINLAIQTLTDPNDNLQRLARRLLRNQPEGAKALLDYEPLSYFTTLNDWRREVYNPTVGIVDPVNNAYVVAERSYDDSEFEALIKDPKVSEIQALIVEIYPDSFRMTMESIINAKDLLPNLKALFVGDGDPYNREYRRSQLYVVDIKPFLEAFPNLQVLQIFGRFCDDSLECGGFRHENLRTLIIETAHLSRHNLDQIGSIDLPNLEHFELWLGKFGPSPLAVINALTPILSGMTTLKLKYLGLCTGDNTDGLVEEILKVPMIELLAVLDFKMGTMTEKGVDMLINDPNITNLKYLDLFGNFLSMDAISKLQKLPFPVNTDNPHLDERWLNEDPAEYRRWALIE